MRNRSYLIMTLVCLFVVGVDQWTKQLVLQNIHPGQVIPIIEDFFNLTLHFNPGAAFGILAGLSDGTRQVVLALTTCAALALVVYLLFAHYREDRLGQIALALIIGGAFGNLIDRVFIGEVVDFLDFYYSKLGHWPAFNAADSAICLGVFILIFHPGEKKSDQHG